ncbi:MULTISPECIES: phosphate signaling complex protein PhoU [Latilactobacillus]|jgi:phosphate transport system protein|uniref:Phosphate-specific transport system accessory protein PhoU n=2 Tax=Latilactobacillus curvatus TaxID=28038 RepID=A0A0B2XKA8_LATCU|nr:phosphate signaling complex protein PhoU [Latilactobacillus curvatus]MDT3393653.1 phosphate signaling complex protein PhoU [Bacillota bacterium]ANJ68959.1 phosphate transport system regulatory protein PhoU [Latilactobacillus curvatus]AOO75892.1 phosphate transport system regulatory protein PhoU [Latilactobacillus curvatus]ASN60539.1 phosphate transport system regulatory protein PhoU [Latilactobacillus curvatus]AWV73388.1 phosphate transport system regulatory protein PhoU [Latilactobacillus 
MRRLFEDELNDLHVRFSEMGMMVNEAIYKSVKAFINHDKQLAREVIADDHKINERETDLERKSFELIALQQPVSTDLRVIVTIMKASSDLERMGDHAVSIAKSTIRVKGNTRVPDIEKDIADMADKVKQMVEEVLDAYVKEDRKKAIKIADEDVAINAYSDNIYDDCIKEMQRDSETVVGSMDYMLVASYLERIGDYVTNICEWIVYLRTGKVVELNSNAQEDEF